MFTVNKNILEFKATLIDISKHFMFTVNSIIDKMVNRVYTFQNISCLRLIKILLISMLSLFFISKHFMFTVNFVTKYGKIYKQNFKTFHVYG